MAAKDIRTLLEQFLDHLEIERNRALRTRTNYQFYLGRFLDWARSRRKGKDIAPGDIDDELVREFRLWLNRVENGRGEELKKNTQNYHLIALRAFLKYLAKRDVKTLPAEKIELGKMPERMVAFLEPTDLERLLAAPLAGTTDKPDAIRLRDKAILELLFSTGLRVSELAGLNKEDVNLERDEFTVRGKGRKLRVVFLSEQAKYWIKQYLAQRRDVSPFLFVAHDRARKGREEADASGLTPRSVERIVSRYSRAAGHGPAHERRRHPLRADAPWAREHHHHPDLYPRHQPAAQGGPQGVPLETPEEGLTRERFPRRFTGPPR
jgi:site-specific recombinase XerD